MKKCFALMMVLVLMLGLSGCFGGAPETTVPSTAAPTTEPSTVPTTAPTEPQNDALVAGISLDGMTQDDAAAALTEAAASYQLELTINGKTITVSAEELPVVLDQQALEQYYLAAFTGVGGEMPSAVFTYDRAVLTALLGSKLDTEPENAVVAYDASKNQFVAEGGVNGAKYDLEAAADALAEAIGYLNPTAEIEVPVTETAPEITADGEKMTAALNKANGYLGVSLTYTFTPEGGTTAKETIGASTVAGFITVSDQLEVSVSKSAIENWAETVSSSHNGADTKGNFVTTGGSSIGYTVTYQGQRVNKSALVDDVYKCITEGTSGTRTAPYRAKSSKPYGGSYVEIDLSSQKLWLYKDGEQILKTSLVSGSVAEGHRTPTGVYSIYAKQTDRYLTGEDYRSFVSYWMPFLGGYGLHDATWRSSFGGTIYYYDGSHGCVNLPSSAAKKIYNNISVGTKVILYGGKTEVPDLEQKLSGTTSYTVTQGDKAFKLDVKAKYKDAVLSYASSDTNVVTVAADGTVTIKGAGTATITVTAAPFDFYTGAELKVTITVKASESKPTEPPVTEPPVTEPPVTEPPVTEPPVTEPPVTEPPVTEPPVTEPPVTEPPVTEPPVTEPPAADPAE